VYDPVLKAANLSDALERMQEIKKQSEESVLMET